MDDLLVILVVEDEQSIQSIVEEALTDGGFEPPIPVASCGQPQALLPLWHHNHEIPAMELCSALQAAQSNGT